MSVLVEALSLVIPRDILDVRYPGGSETFMLDMCDPDVPSLLVCADDELVSVSFPDADAVVNVGARLLALGIVAVDEGCYLELAFVDPSVGPIMPCDWIEWGKDASGATCCWLAGTEPELMHAPANRKAEHGDHALEDHLAEPGRCLKLADDDGIETWLDFQTGQVLSGVRTRSCETVDMDETGSRNADANTSIGGHTMGSPNPFADHEEGEGDEDPEIDDVLEQILNPPAVDLMATVRSMLDGHHYHYHQLTPETLTFTICNEHATYNLLFAVQVKKSLVQIMSTYGSHAPADRRVAVAEALSRINTVHGLGNFEVDFDDGDIRFRVGIDVEEGVFSEKMASNMLSCTMYCMERYHDALMRVMFGDAEPADALASLT